MENYDSTNFNNFNNFKIIKKLDESHEVVLNKDTPVLTYSGIIKRVQDIRIGDFLMGDDSMPRYVTSLATGREKMYKVTLTNGENFTVNKSHILSLYCTGLSSIRPLSEEKGFIVSWYKNLKENVMYFPFQEYKYKKDTFNAAIAFFNCIEMQPDTDKNGAVFDVSIEDYLKLSPFVRKHLKAYKTAVEFYPVPVDVDPYLLGCWLGNKKIYSTPEYFPIDAVTGLRKFIEDKQLNHCKYIPHVYKCNTKDIRLQILAGIIDFSGGKITNGSIKIILDDKTLIEDVIFVCQSLGFETLKSNQGSLRTLYILGNNLNILPISSNNHVQNVQMLDTVLTYDFNLTELPEDDYYGFTIDGNRRFLLGNFVVTHNTY